uniref:Signal-induced proliferation-associated 1 n=1 Tax=Kryptolebias marmoratus TaxID=37003 RepID=A0A3Q3A804_KRYMA
MQSDDFFIRKFRRQNVRPPIATVNFDPKHESSVVEWPPRRAGDGADADTLTPSRVGLTLRSVGRGHIMQRSNSDVTLGDLDSSGKSGGKIVRMVGDKVGVGSQGDSGVLLHREYGSLSSLERQSQAQEPSADGQGPLSPSALRFKDPFLLLGLNENPLEPDGFFRGLSASTGDSHKPDKPPKPEGLSKKSKPTPPQVPQPGPYDNLGGGAWVRNFAHYDVQSILFDLTEVATNRDSIGRKKNITSGASAASQLRPPSQSSLSSPAQGGGSNGANADDPEQSLLLDEGDGNDNELLLSCPHFRNETGGEEQVGLGQSSGRRGLWSSLRTPNDAVSVLEEPRESHVQLQGKSNYFIEHADLGAHYYRKYFYMKHQNFFGIDDRLGPVAISFRREEKEGSSGAQYNYRIIFRTTEQMKTLRGSILEESVPSAARHTTPRGLSPKRLLEFIMPELNLQCLRLASNSPKVRDTLLKLDEQGLNFQRKVGVMYCRAGQSSEEDMYNNESSGPAFEQFLDLLGERVRLKGWEKYRAQLDNKDSTGTHSLYTRYQDYEIMFHVSTMLPYTANNTQQLLRKRHIGNDIVTIVFQEPGALPFTPKSIRSHFQHVFIIVQVHEPGTENAHYVAVTRSKDIPLFGPLFPKGARFPRSPAFRDFLLAKVVNAENAAEKSEKFRSMATRTRQEYLKDLAENYVTTTPIDSSTKFPLLSLGGKRKDKLKGAKGAELHSAGALVWAVVVNREDEWEAGERKLPCLLGVSAESVVLIERCSRRVVFNCSCRDVIGWKAVTETKEGGPCLDIFYERGESVSISVLESQAEDIKEVVQRLELVTRGCEALEVTPLRDGVGQPGFLMNEEGFVTELQRFCYAESGGLQLWARVVRLCGHSLVHLSSEERTKLLRTAHKIHITVIPPDENGKPRSFSELYQKAIKDAECKPGEDQSGEAWVVDEREEELEEEEERATEEESKADRVGEVELVEVQMETDGVEEQTCDKGPNDETYSLLTLPALPLLRATSLQEQPANQSQESSASQITRSLSLERQLSYTDTCDG